MLLGRGYERREVVYYVSRRHALALPQHAFALGSKLPRQVLNVCAQRRST